MPQCQMFREGLVQLPEPKTRWSSWFLAILAFDMAMNYLDLRSRGFRSIFQISPFSLLTSCPLCYYVCTDEDEVFLRRFNSTPPPSHAHGVRQAADQSCRKQKNSCFDALPSTLHPHAKKESPGHNRVWAHSSSQRLSPKSLKPTRTRALNP